MYGSMLMIINIDQKIFRKYFKLQNNEMMMFPLPFSSKWLFSWRDNLHANSGNKITFTTLVDHRTQCEE